MKKTIPMAFVENLEDYESLFSNVRNEKAIGESSISYLYSKVAAKEIFKFNPKAKIIIILRNPLERAFSHYLMDLKHGYASGSFIEEIKKDQIRERKGWGISNLYIELGKYEEQIKRFTKIFPKEQILLLNFDDLKKNNKKLIRRVFNFLNIDQNVKIDLDEIHNKSKVPKNNFVKGIMKIRPLRKILRKMPNKFKLYFENRFFSDKNNPKLTEEDREFMNKYYL